MDNVAANIELFKLINSHHNPTFDIIFQCIRWLGTGYVMIPLLILAYLYRKPKLGPLFFAFLLETAIVHYLKNSVDQPRPAAAGIGPVHLLQNVHYGSFPSGDVAMAATIASIMSRGEKPVVQVVWYLYVLLIAYERMYIGAHFPIDVLAGAAIGVVSACAIWRVWPARKPAQQEDPVSTIEKDLAEV